MVRGLVVLVPWVLNWSLDCSLEGCFLARQSFRQGEARLTGRKSPGGVSAQDFLGIKERYQGT